MKCGYDHGLCDLPGWWLPPGSMLKGRYMVGKSLSSNDHQITYLGWDLETEKTVDIAEYFPRALVTRDITNSEEVVTVPGREAQVDAGRQAFFERAKLFYQCAGRVEELMMDFFLRNNTCYYILRREK